eukprot:scaffold1350_cov137-Skeletonema_dohrnii-CCMP3373.AAC.11
MERKEQEVSWQRRKKSSPCRELTVNIDDIAPTGAPQCLFVPVEEVVGVDALGSMRACSKNRSKNALRKDLRRN